jgi:hypothetical protein
MNDWTDYDWTPEERALINRDREVQLAVLCFLNMSWFGRRRCMLLCNWIRFTFWVRKHECLIQYAMLAVTVLLIVLAILGAMNANQTFYHRQ